MPEGGRFAELERIKRIVTVHERCLEPRGDGFCASFHLLRVVRREIHARREQSGRFRRLGRCGGRGMRDSAHSRQSFGLSQRYGTHRIRFGRRIGSACYGVSLP